MLRKTCLDKISARKKYSGPPLVQLVHAKALVLVHLTHFFSWETKNSSAAVIHISSTRTMVAITREILLPSQVLKLPHEVFLVSFKSEMGLWLMYVVISADGKTMYFWCDCRQNFFSNFGYAKNWNAFEFAPLGRPGSYLNKKRSTMEDHQKDLTIKRSRFFRIRTNLQFMENVVVSLLSFL